MTKQPPNEKKEHHPTQHKGNKHFEEHWLDQPGRDRKISKAVSVMQIMFPFTLASCRHKIDTNIDLSLKDTISIVPA